MIEIYVSTDIEADGPIPGPNSMLSFASAAYLADKTLVATFEANLTLLPGAAGDPKTMAWWQCPATTTSARPMTRDPLPSSARGRAGPWVVRTPACSS